MANRRPAYRGCEMVMALLTFGVTNESGFRAALESSGELFENAAGFHGFELRQGVEEPNRFLITADWDSVEAHKAWQASYASDFLGRLEPFIDRPPEIRHFV